MGKYVNLMKPISFGKKIIATNRIYFSSIGFDLCDPMGRPIPEFFEVYDSIMDGGCGFGFLGNASVDPLSQYTDRSMKLVSKSHAQDLFPVFKLAEKKNFPLGVQLQHYGVIKNNKVDPRIKCNSSIVKGDVTFVSEEQIMEYIDQFHTAALNALSIGAPSLQIHAANGYLLSSFLSPRTNRRNDKWGGSPLNRARILLEIISRIRASVRDQMAIFGKCQ